ncbi:MAG: DNA primase [Lentisphaerae bacterium]|nr:DNA primase [Lentisphaerota bacterium]
MARIVPKRTLEDIRFRNDIADVIGSYFNLKRAGSTFKALCPFHREKTPSFNVNPKKQIYHCFGCGAGGDVFGFVMQYEGVDFMTAVQLLARRAGIPIEMEEGEGGDGSRKQTLYKIHEEISRFYQRCLHHSMASAKTARGYLAERDLSDDIVEEFLIGYAPQSWDSVIRWGSKNDYDTGILEEAGLLVRREDDNGAVKLYDRFRNRLMFPIRDQQSRVVAFSGRALESGPRIAKYVNSPETPLFQKSRVLYALDQARHAIVDGGRAILCEGQIDVIRCHQVDLKNAVAAQGTAFTEDHARVLKRYADSVVIVFDPDKAGQDAAIRTSTVFMDAGLAVRIAVLPQGEDPDTFIRQNGAKAFGEILEKARSAVSYQVEVLSSREDAASEIGVMRIAKAVLDTIGHSPNAVQRARLVQEAAERLRLPVSALQDDLRFQLRRERSREQARAGRRGDETTETTTSRPPEEVELCEHMVNVADWAEAGSLVREYLPLDMISDDFCRTVIGAALQAEETGRDIGDVLRESTSPSPELQEFAARVRMAPTKATGKESTPVDAVRSIILRLWQREVRRRRDACGPDDGKRRTEMTYSLDRLKHWDTGSAIIRMEIDAD